MFVFAVTPCVGVWIEMVGIASLEGRRNVTPCVGVWIEIITGIQKLKSCRSLPVWECGLK